MAEAEDQTFANSSRCTPSAVSDTKLQFHQDQIHFLIGHETQIAVFEANKLECVTLKQVLFLLLSF